MLGMAMLPLAAACASGMNVSSALVSPSGQADAQAHAFVSALDAGEVQMAQLAQSRGQSDAVRGFAQRMITEHSNALGMREERLGARGLGLRASTRAVANMNGGSMGSGNASADASMGSASGMRGMSGTGMFTSAMVLSPAGMSDLNAVLMANPASRPVAQGAMADIQRLQALSGRPFDQAYIRGQVEMHQYALSSVDHILAQNAVSSEMRGMLTTMRAAIAMHLQMAQQMHSQLM
ncbi:MAG TPA: DUF4142 domain-containing protein [Longimicrobium sp.]